MARIHILVHKILCRQESVMTPLTPMQTKSAPKSICPPPHRMGLGDIMTHQSKRVRVPVGWRSCWPLYSRWSYLTVWFVNCFTKRKVTWLQTHWSSLTRTFAESLQIQRCQQLPFICYILLTVCVDWFSEWWSFWIAEGYYNILIGGDQEYHCSLPALCSWEITTRLYCFIPAILKHQIMWQILHCIWINTYEIIWFLVA